MVSKCPSSGLQMAQEASRWLQEIPRWPQVGSKRPQDGLYRLQEGSKGPPRWLREAPRWLRKGPTWAKNGPKSLARGLQMVQMECQNGVIRDNRQFQKKKTCFSSVFSMKMPSEGLKMAQFLIDFDQCGLILTDLE